MCEQRLHYRILPLTTTLIDLKKQQSDYTKKKLKTQNRKKKKIPQYRGSRGRQSTHRRAALRRRQSQTTRLTRATQTPQLAVFIKSTTKNRTKSDSGWGKTTTTNYYFVFFQIESNRIEWPERRVQCDRRAVTDRTQTQSVSPMSMTIYSDSASIQHSNK